MYEGNPQSNDRLAVKNLDKVFIDGFSILQAYFTCQHNRRLLLSTFLNAAPLSLTPLHRRRELNRVNSGSSNKRKFISLSTNHQSSIRSQCLVPLVEQFHRLEYWACYFALSYAHLCGHF